MHPNGAVKMPSCLAAAVETNNISLGNYPDEIRQLHRAIRHDKPDDIIAIATKVNVNAYYHGYTALLAAVKHNQACPVLQHLLNIGANPCMTQPITGSSAMHLAAAGNRLQVMQLLALADSELIDSQDLLGNSPLMTAAENLATEAAELLLSWGANKRLHNLFGKCAMDLARKLKNRSIYDAIAKPIQSSGKGGRYKQYLYKLCKAAFYGKTNDVVKLSSNVSLNAKLNGWTPAMYAAAGCWSDCSIFVKLVQLDADLSVSDDYGTTVMHLAAASDNVKLCELVLEIDPSAARIVDDFQRNALMLAAEYNSYRTVQFLLASQAVDFYAIDAAGRSAADIAVECQCSSVMQLLLTSQMAQFDDKIMYKKKLQHICKLAASGKEEKLRKSIKSIDNINEKFVSKTPLMWAAGSNHDRGANCVPILLNSGADPFITDEYGRTALHLAAAANSCQVLQSLVPIGGIDGRDSDGNTAMMLGIIAGNYEAAQLLVMAGADVQVRNNSGDDARQLAQVHDRLFIMQLLNYVE